MIGPMTNNTTLTADTITTAQIRALRTEALAAGDHAQVDICDSALNLRANGAEAAGETWAAKACADAINAGQG